MKNGVLDFCMTSIIVYLVDYNQEKAGNTEVNPYGTELCNKGRSDHHKTKKVSAPKRFHFKMNTRNKSNYRQHNYIFTKKENKQ